MVCISSIIRPIVHRKTSFLRSHHPNPLFEPFFLLWTCFEYMILYGISSQYTKMDTLSCSIEKKKANSKGVRSPKANSSPAGIKVKATCNASHLNASHVKEFEKYNSEGKDHEEKVIMYLRFVSFGMTRSGKPIRDKELFQKCGISKSAAHT